MTDAPLYPATGQVRCYDVAGREIPCAGSGQDAEYRHGTPWPQPRFEVRGGQVRDRLTGLFWSRDANPCEFPLTWDEALAAVRRLNHDRYQGADDWRLPNRRELRSLVSHQTRRPALPEDHPFENLFLGWYWSSTSYAGNPAHAWYVHMEGARMFYGGKDQSYLVWPVRGTGNGLLARTGQRRCFTGDGTPIDCVGTGQDGEYRLGRPWPRPRFRSHPLGIQDALTGLVWRREADLTDGVVSWPEALEAAAALGRREDIAWRLPNILELESLTDCERFSPALPSDAPFVNLREAYWSSTTSCFEPDWAWALYLDKGAVGVGQKRGRHFHVWVVTHPGNDAVSTT